VRRLAFWLATAVVFTLPWENVAGLPGLGSISRVAGLAAAGAWGLAVLGSGSVRQPLPAHVVAFLFVLWNGLSVAWSVDVGVSIGRFFTFVQLFVMVYILWDTVRTYTDLRTVQQAYVLGAWVTVIALVRGYLVHGPALYQVRFTVGDFQFDDIGLVFALGIPLAWYLATNPTRTRGGYVLQCLNVVHVPAAVVGIMFSGSRVAMIAVGPSVVYIVVTLVRLSPRLRLLAGVAIAGTFLALLPLVPKGTIERLTSTASDRSQGDFNGRTELWHQAYETFREHPFTGVGTAAFREETSWKVAHDVWLRFAAELGLVGLGLFLLMLGMMFVYAWRQPPALRWFSTTLLTVWMIGATFYNAEDKKQTWLVLSLVMLCTSLVKDVRQLPSGASGPEQLCLAATQAG
jgi:O-antigen ligase